MAPRSLRVRGFTLVEVLIAMSIMAIVSVMSWQGVDGIMRARDVTQAKVDQVLRASTVIAQWEQDLGAIQNTEAETGVPALRFDGARAFMTRRSDRGLQVVVWARREGAWFRWASPASTTVQGLVDAWNSSQQLMGNESGQLKTLAGLTDWQVYYVAPGAQTWSNAQSSTSSGQTAGGAGTGNPVTQLPVAVRIVLSFDGSSGLAGSITRDIALDAT
jgi:general secretion pathway protein J